MATSLADQYYIKALDTYPYDLESAMENLDYALSYDYAHAGANYLMGRMQMEQFENYRLAETYFQEALGNSPESVQVCEKYSILLIRLRKYEKAKRLLDYLLKLPGVNLSQAFHLYALWFEYQKQYTDAMAWLNNAMEETFYNSQMEFLEGEMERVKMKLERSGRVKYSVSD